MHAMVHMPKLMYYIVGPIFNSNDAQRGLQ